MGPNANTSPPRAVFFDAGDTLLDTSAMLDSALFTALVPIDPRRTIEDVRDAVSRSGEALPVRQPPFYEVRGNAQWWIDRYAAVGHALGLEGDAHARFLDTVTTGHFGGDALHVVSDAPAALSRLAARGVRLGVISNWDDTLEPILERKGLRRWFDVVLASTVLGVAKPDRRIFERALREIGADAPDAWHVGDDLVADAKGAAAAGMRAVLLDPFGMYRAGGAIVTARTLTEAVDRILA